MDELGNSDSAGINAGKKEHNEYGPYWIVDHERQPVADFMNGNSGVLHFLLRQCYPEKISYPLL